MTICLLLLAGTMIGNQPPVAFNDIYGVPEDDVLATTIQSSVLRNDYDPDDGPEPLTAVLHREPEHGTLILNADGSFVYIPDPDWNGHETFGYKAFDGEDFSPYKNVTIIVYPVNEVVGRYVAYPGSVHGWNVAPDKVALQVGETAEWENYTSYWLGITGIVIDIESFSPEGDITEDDFVFQVGSTDDFNNWPLAPPPISITTAQDVGVNGADRVYIEFGVWDVHDEWIMVSLIPRDFDLALWTEEVFFFGHRAGETTGDFLVNYDDAFTGIWPSLFSPPPITIDHPADVNRDGVINYDDVYNVVWPNLFGPALAIITPQE